MSDDFFTTPIRHLTQANVEGLLRSRVGETAALDFKQPSEAKKLSVDIAAMANSGGGRIVVGVKDPEREYAKNPTATTSDLLVPLPRATPIEAQVRGWVVRIRPPVRCETRLIDVGALLGASDAYVAVIDVEGTDWGIHQDESGVFPIRVGSQSVPAPWEVVRDRLASASRTVDAVEKRYPRFEGQKFGPAFNVQRPFARINAALMPRTPLTIQDELNLARRIVKFSAEHLEGRHREAALDRIEIDAHKFHMGLAVGFDGDAAFNASPESVFKQQPFFKPDLLDKASIGAGALNVILAAFFRFYADTFRDEMGGHSFVVRIEIGGQGAHLGFDPVPMDPEAAKAHPGRGMAWLGVTDVKVVHVASAHDVQSHADLARRVVKAVGRRFGVFLDDDLHAQSLGEGQ